MSSLCMDVQDIRKTRPSKTPLVVLHGGPGACHDYLLPLADLATLHNIPVILYDQIGNGRSTHLRDKYGNKSFWTPALFSAELDNLIAKLGLSNRPIDVYGHSWGGMVAIEWAALQPKNLRRFILASNLASIDGWLQGVNRLKKDLPENVQLVLDRGEDKKDFDSPEYEAALEVFYKRHVSLTRPWPPQEVTAALDWLDKDPTVDMTMWGPSGFSISGSLRDWTSISVLHQINVSTLVIAGAEDEAQDEGLRPFKKIPKVKWLTLDHAGHFSHVDQKEKHLAEVADFLSS